ncbi:helix-turn-helix domain-containing protein [Neptunicella marina]|uniref:Helix-turn-helix transcriptional regulator n=1 Tax=Neptunicella marina TaxID=2125989 RepID=A0A8J6IT87_9ALTE|nr:helix-turn-helix transcriptional regulator [Neptunicella marina]MBC3767020.1 helix-turn-helix transcriptional regulator [Neptunicella marina]
MKFGERLKQLRQRQNLTQPEMAQAIGIEQSYLSKLENDKSVPSADMLDAILGCLNMSLQQFLSPLSATAMNSLSTIPAVKEWQSNTQYNLQRKRKIWLKIYAIAVIVGSCCIVAGSQALIFGEKSYQYVSKGIVYPGESKEVFSNWRHIYHQQMEGASDEQRDEIRQKMASKGVEMIKRENEYYLVESNYQGELFNIDVESGSRTFRLTAVKDTINRANQLLLLLGWLVLLTGLLGYINDWRLHRQP